MVKESERKRAYRPRAPHKEGCACVVCIAKRAPLAEIEVKISPPPPPTEVRLDSIPISTKFELAGQECLVKERVEGMVVCYNLAISDTATLSGATMVKPV